MKINGSKFIVSVLAPALLWAGTCAYAEHTAPVYDVDGMSIDSQAASSADEHAKAALTQALTTSSEPPPNVGQRIERLEQQLANLQQNELSNRLNGIQGEVQALRGQVEELHHQLQDLRSQNQQRAEADIKQSKMAEQQTMSPVPRVSDEEGSPSSEAVPAKSLTKAGNSAERRAVSAKQTALPRSTQKSSAAGEQINLAEEQAVYQTAYNLIKLKKYNDAIAALQKMLTKYPAGPSAANAHYWLGELYSLTNENEQAASEFGLVVKQYPNSPRVADAELKLGLLNATLLKWPAAKASFKKVISKYPGTTSARLAMEQLKLLKQSGH